MCGAMNNGIISQEEGEENNCYPIGETIRDIGWSLVAATMLLNYEHIHIKLGYVVYTIQKLI